MMKVPGLTARQPEWVIGNRLPFSTGHSRLHLQLSLRQILDELDQAGMIEIAMAQAFHRSHHLANDTGNHERHAVFRAGRQSDFHVLFMQTDTKAGFEVAIEHFLPVRFENFRLSETAEERLPDFYRIDARLGRKHQRFPNDRDGRTDNHLIGCFSDLAGAGVADMNNVLTELLERLAWPVRPSA